MDRRVAYASETASEHLDQLGIAIKAAVLAEERAVGIAVINYVARGGSPTATALLSERVSALAGVNRAAAPLKWLGPIGIGLGAVGGGMERWQMDSGRGDLSTGEKVTRTVIQGAAPTAAGVFVGGAASTALAATTVPIGMACAASLICGAIVVGALGIGAAVGTTSVINWQFE